MNRVIDDPEEVAEDFIRGALPARPDLLAATEHPRVVRRSGLAQPRGGVATCGGSGQEPAFAGYVGPGLGERSRGHLDAGAASAELLLRTLADGLQARLEDAP